MRTRDDALAAGQAADPVWLARLMTADELMVESKDTWEAQSRRRDEAAAALIDAGMTYADVGRIIRVTTERARQLIARHYGLHVNQLNPRTRTSKPTH